MAYAIITKNNCLYQSRDNIKTLIKNNLTNSAIEIYSKFPNLKGGSFSGYPFIVLLDSNDAVTNDYHGTSVYEFNDNMEGVIYHASDMITDNQLRTTKQDIIKSIMNKTNRKLLSGYGTKDISVNFDNNLGEDYIVMNQKQLYPQGFTVLFNTEVNFD